VACGYRFGYVDVNFETCFGTALNQELMIIRVGPSLIEIGAEARCGVVGGL